MRTILPLVLAFLVAVPALAVDVTNGPNNRAPQPDIPDASGYPNKDGYSNDPQIASLFVDSTGVTAATTGFTVLASATHMTPVSHRGYTTADATTGAITLRKSGLFLAFYTGVCSATTADVSTLEIATTTDAVTYTAIAGGTTTVTHLTGVLAQNAVILGAFSVTSAQASAGTFRVAALGKNSAHTTTCVQGGLSIIRLDTAQPLNPP